MPLARAARSALRRHARSASFEHAARGGGISRLAGRLLSDETIALGRLRFYQRRGSSGLVGQWMRSAGAAR